MNRTIKYRVYAYFIMALIANLLIFCCGYDFTNNLGYGILASVIVAALIDEINYEMQKRIVEQSLNREMMRISESCRVLISDVRNCCEELGLQIDGGSSFSEMNKLFFVDVFLPGSVYNDAFHSFLTERIISRYLMIRTQLYDLISFINAQDENMDDRGRENGVLIKKAKDLISSIDAIETKHAFHVAFEKNAGFSDLQEMNYVIDNEFIPKVEEMFPKLKEEFNNIKNSDRNVKN